MKIRKFMAMMVAAIAITVGMSSCGSDDDDQEAAVAAQVAGAFNGHEVLTVSAGGSTSDFTRDTAYVFTKATDTTLDLTIPAMDDMGHMSIPALSVKGISLTTDGKTINGTLDSYAGTALTADSVEKAFTVTDLVVVFSDKAAVVTYTLKYGNMPFPFAGQFTGVKE
jgi:hypothetical protein